MYKLSYMANETTTLGQDVLDLLEQGQNREQIEALLLGKGHDVKFVNELVRETIKFRQTKRMAQGLALIAGGAVICLVSCVLTITLNLSHESFAWVLYGLTSVGIAVIFAGFMRVF